MEVQTVRGKVLASELGVILPHEHIFSDMRSLWSRPSQESKAKLADVRVSLEIMGFLMHDMAICRDNLVLNDPDTAAKELLMFKALGGKTIVDVTTLGFLPDPAFLRAARLRELGTLTGLNIVVGCGYYTARTHPPDLMNRSVDQLADEMISAIQVGLEGTEVKAGIIGEIGTSHPFAESEKKVLRAAGHAQKSTGVAVTVHLPWRGKHGLQVIDILESEGVDSRKIIIDHMDDMEDMSFEYHRAIAERDVYLEFDCFGQEDYVESENFVHPRDTERVLALKRLVDIGYVDNILLSQDVCLKTYTRTYGGYGYDHIQRTIVPMMKQIGLTEIEIEHMMIENPARALAH